MPDQAERMNRAVELLLRGGRVKAGPGLGADRDALMAAAELAAARDAYPGMTLAFRRRLAGLISDEPVDEHKLTRRAALAAAAGLAAGALGVAGLERVASRPAPPAELAGGWFRVASLTDIPEDAPLRVLARSTIVYLFRSGQAVRSLSAICSDQPCTLAWHAADAELYCPCHRAEFSDTGEPLGAAAVKYHVPQLPAYPVKVVGGDVYLKPTL